MNIRIPELSLVVLVGPSGAGKSTFARRHFKPTEVISSDYCRGLISDDENNQSVTNDAFEVLHFIVGKRLATGKLTVIDATNVQVEARKPLVALARQYHCIPVAMVFDLPEAVCRERNRTRSDRDFGSYVIRQQIQQLRRSMRGLEREGFRHLSVMRSVEEVDGASIERQPLWCDLRAEAGPFDIVGDIHGCRAELEALLDRLGYVGPERRHPEGRKLVFLGDLVDRGPDTPGVLRLAISMVESGAALCVPGNHDIKLMRKLRGRKVQVSHGMAESLAQLETESEEFKSKVADFIDKRVSHYVLDGDRLVVAHAGMKQSMQGRGSGAVRAFALFGETTGETDEFGLPIRYDWASEYRGKAMVVYGHTAVPEAEWLNGTINIDTGCVYGGKLTALRYPERELVSVPAQRVWCEPARPLLELQSDRLALSAQQSHDDLLDIADVIGKRSISTGIHHNVTVREENAAAALEVMSRFAANPKWLIYLPPTMAPCETTDVQGLLEHPGKAFAHYRKEGISSVMCEEKHMGSRTVVVLCRDREVARRRFGIAEDEFGICYTRTGRRFFDDPALERELLTRLRSAVDASNLWDELNTDWLCLDCELMPWSAKAQELLRSQYAAVGAASRASLDEAIAALEAAEARNPEVGALLHRSRERAELASKFVTSYRRYCWPVSSVDDLRLAPFHLLASEGAVHTSRDHRWHMEIIGRLCANGAPLLLSTKHRTVDLGDPQSEADAIEWWTRHTESGGEGMVVKPMDFIARGRRSLIQPAIKCRGPEYLRIIYGPEYTMPQNLERLRSRGLSVKRSLALREFALGIEGLDRFVNGEPLRRVHECVFGVLALESEPVDPRL